MSYRLLPIVTLLSAIAIFNSPIRGQVRPEEKRLSTFPAISLEQLHETRDRPLFEANRRPPTQIPIPPSQPQAAVVVTSENESNDPKIALLGIIVTPPSPIVLLRDEKTSRFVTVRSGDSVGRWKIIADDDRSVTLVGEGRQVTLEMFQDH